MKNSLQMNLDSFLISKNKRKQFFYIDWNEQNTMAKWVLNKTKDLSFRATVRWTYIGDIIICCKNRETINDIESPINEYLSKINSKLFDEKRQLLSFIKSHLQKCIRRQKK